MKRNPTGLLRWLAVLGPGLIATSAGNDAGGIATYTQAGAKFGYKLIWVMVILTVSFGVVQEMCARLGAATGRGLLDLIRERFGIGWALFAIVVILIANGGVTVSEFVGIGAATELLGVSKYVSVPLGASLNLVPGDLWFVREGRENPAANDTRVLCLPGGRIYGETELERGCAWSICSHDHNRSSLPPYCSRLARYDYHSLHSNFSTELAGGKGRGAAALRFGENRRLLRRDIFKSHVNFDDHCDGSHLVCCGPARNQVQPADAARALEPVVGSAARVLFGIGLLGATLLAGAVLPLATAYAVSEAFGMPKGVNLDFRRGKIFFSLFTALIVIGVVLALIPNIPVMQLLVGVQVLNGVLLPIILVFILLLINDKNLTKELKNTRANNVLAVGTLILITTAVAVMLGGQLLEWLGII